jgi:hypothetical protein
MGFTGRFVLPVNTWLNIATMHALALKVAIAALCAAPLV